MYTRLLLYMLAGSSIPIHTYGQQWENDGRLGSIEPRYTPQELYVLGLQHEADQYERRNSEKTHQNAGPGSAQNSHAKVRSTPGANLHAKALAISVALPILSGLHNTFLPQTSPTTSRVPTIEDLTGKLNSPNNAGYLNNQGPNQQRQPLQTGQVPIVQVPIGSQVHNNQPIRDQQVEGRPLADQHGTHRTQIYDQNTGTYRISGQHVPTNLESTSQVGSQNKYNYDRTQIDEQSGTYDDQKPVRPPQLGPKPSQLAISTMSCGIKMMQQLGHERQGNSVISPLSIVIALSTLQQGAHGQTELELAKFLQSDAETSRERIRSFRTNSKIAAQGNILKIANGVFVNNAFTLNGDFKNFAVKDFRADVVPLNFRQPSYATKEINSWVSKSTGNLIPTLVDSRGLDPSTQLLLTNAVFFKGIWNTTFPMDRTRPMTFTGDSGEKTVNFMAQIGQFRAGDDEALNARWLFLPFLNEEFNMLFVLPDKALGLDRLIESLTEAALERILRDTQTREVIMRIPKFKLSFETDLVNTLVQSGIQSIFNPAADLRGIGSSLGNEALYVSKVLHKATIEIDEQGSAAAAVTSLAVNTLSLSSYNDEFRFTANHPFLVLLFDKNLSTPLFMAKIVDP